MSDDQRFGLTIIGFVGSVFSPYYKRARRAGPAEALNHCAINVALYGGVKRWAMTERGHTQVERKENLFRVGPSHMMWADDSLIIDINERCVPLPYTLRGRVKLRPRAIYDHPIALDAIGHHLWRAVSPHGDVEVEMQAPALSWRGVGYHDMNWGNEPLEAGFRDWTWARSTTAEATDVIYDVTRRDNSQNAFGMRFSNGVVSSLPVPGEQKLPRGFWGMARPVRSEESPRLIATLEDAPFYTRNHVCVTIQGTPRNAVHESLSLDRFSHPIVQRMLPFRMPRRE